MNSLQQQLQKTDVVPNVSNTQQVRRLITVKQQVKKLNNLDSQAWLYEGILERIGSDPSVNHEKIAKTLEALEYKRNEILKELEPRKPQKYRVLSKLQNSVRDILGSQDEKDYKQLQKIVNNLILFTKSKQPSQIILSEIIAKLVSEISQNNKQISPSRLRIAYKIEELMRVLSKKLILDSNSSRTDSNYQLIVNELQSRINLLSQEFNNLLKTKQEDKKELNRRNQEVSNLTKNISDLHRDISNRDSDIFTLSHNIQSLMKSVKEKQSQVDDILAYAKRIESEIKTIENDKSYLSSRKLELERENQILYQQYLQQQDMISSLSKQLADLRELYSSIKSVSTKPKLSEAEYQKISNQDEYEIVSGHTKKSGTWVEQYYRRKRKQ